MKRRVEMAVVAGIVMATVVARVAGLNADCLDGDEIFSIITVRYGWDHTIQEMIQDAIHPPLFYVLLRGWIAIGGECLWWVRLFPALISAVAIVPLWHLCRELECGPRARLTALALFAVNPFLVDYAQHVRMYSLLMLLSVTSLWLFTRVVRRGWSAGVGAALFAVNLAIVYTQYYGWVVVGLETAIVLLWRRVLLWQVWGQVVAIGVMFLPWAWFAARSLAAKGGTAENLGWIGRPEWSEFLWYFVDVAGLSDLQNPGSSIEMVIGICLLLLLAGAGLGRYGWRDTGRYFLVACFALGPPVAAFVVSQVTPHAIWGHRHLILSAVPLLVFFVVVAEAPPWRWARVAATGVLLLWVGHSAIGLAERPKRKAAWDELVFQALERESGSGIVPLYALQPPAVLFHFWFFLEEWKAGRTGLMAVDIPSDIDMEEYARRAARIDLRPTNELFDTDDAYYWAAFSSVTLPASAAAIPAEHGCRVGPVSEVSDRYQTIRAFPVDCRGAPSDEEPL